jgi:histidyl-tRNA synthetase
MASKSLIQAVKGTREYYPEEMAQRNFINDKAREVSQMFGYQEWDAPFIETIDLYAAKSGEELVKKQSFVFTDRGGNLVTLRPELTPSLARMIAQKQGELVFPLRWWAFGPFWRYEQPQKGRAREFFQWNIDMLGANSPEADAELITIAATFLKLVGLTPAQVKIYINDRRLMTAEFDSLGIPPEKRREASHLIDRRPKMTSDAWDAYALEFGFSQGQVEGLKLVLENFDLWKKDTNLCRLFAALRALGLSEYTEFNPAVMRGLDYYTGTVFEVFDITGSVRRSLFGGGRYDNLTQDVGGDPVPAVGFAMGDLAIGILLKEKGLIPPFVPSPAPVLVTIFDESLWMESYTLAAELRATGLKVTVYPEPAKLPKQFKFADRMGMRITIVVGPDEAAAGKVTVKDLKTSTQQTVARADAEKTIRKILESV